MRRPGELVGIDCFCVGRLKGTEGAIWQLTAIDIASCYAWAELVICKQGNPTARQTSQLARRVARELKAAGWRLERVLSDNGNEFKGHLNTTTSALKASHTRIHAGRPQTNGHVEALHKTILDECWRPAFARYLYPRYSGLRRELNTYLRFYNHDCVHHGRLARGRIPADIVYRAREDHAPHRIIGPPQARAVEGYNRPAHRACIAGSRRALSVRTGCKSAANPPKPKDLSQINPVSPIRIVGV